VEKLSDNISQADIVIEQERRQGFGKHRVSVFAVLVLDPFQSERTVFLSLHFGKLGRVGAEDFSIASAFHEIGDILGRCPTNLFYEPPD